MCKHVNLPRMQVRIVLFPNIGAMFAVVLGLVLVPAPCYAAVLLEDDFDTGFDSAKWYVKPWDPLGSTYIDGTQLRVDTYKPPVHDGYLDLTFSTYNPTALTPGDSFYGTQIISQQTFLPTAERPVKFTCKARILPPSGQTDVPGGIVASMFVYEKLSVNSRDEIDVEVLTKSQPEGPGFLTNVFVGDPYTAAGDVEYIPVAGYDFRDFHVYEFVWAVDSIEWYLDGQLVRRETESLPTSTMALYFNTWAPLFGGFERALDSTLVPASSEAENIDIIWQLDFARVQSIPEPSALSVAFVAIIVLTISAVVRQLKRGGATSF